MKSEKVLKIKEIGNWKSEIGETFFYPISYFLFPIPDARDCF